MLQSYRIRAKIVPKKNKFRAGITSRGRLYQYRQNSAKDSQLMIHLEAREMARQQGVAMIAKEPVKMTVWLRKTRADSVGLLETILDALEGVAYANDRQVHEYHVGYSKLPEGVNAIIHVEYLHHEKKL